MDPKNTKITHESIYVLYCLYKKFWSQTSIWLSLWLQILPNPSQCYDSSSEILWFVNIVHDRFVRNLFIFYHSLHIWYHEILTNLVIFGLRLLFLEFKNHSATCSWSCFLNKMFEISFHFLGKTHTGLSNMKIIFILILFYYLNHL